jgi:hypothetical protein
MRWTMLLALTLPAATAAEEKVCAGGTRPDRARQPRPDGRLPLSGMTSTTIAVMFRRDRIEQVEHSVGTVVF